LKLGREETKLDCIHDASSDVYYVLDMMVWRGFEYYDCETSFRRFFVEQKLQELECKFIELLPSFQCNGTGVASAVQWIREFRAARGVQASFELDPTCSLLLVCPETHYTPGVTPLVIELSIGEAQRLLSQ
jgi:snurportin-1